MTAALTPGRPFTGSERQLLDNTLQLHRAELVAAVGGLTDTQARLHLVPSLTNTDLTGEALRCSRTDLVSTHTGRLDPR